MNILKLLFSAVVAWLVGLVLVGLSLYVSNNGADFTLHDFMGFGFLLLPASALLMLLIYLPGLLWLRKRSVSQHILFPLMCGLVLNVPVFALLTLLVGRKMSATEALLFMLTFMFIGFTFGLGFIWSQRKPPFRSGTEGRQRSG
jgi:hypothetical protein